MLFNAFLRTEAQRFFPGFQRAGSVSTVKKKMEICLVRVSLRLLIIIRPHESIN